MRVKRKGKEVTTKHLPIIIQYYEEETLLSIRMNVDKQNNYGTSQWYHEDK